MTATKTYIEWADRIAEALNDDELAAFVEAIDGDGYENFFYNLNEINSRRNPHLYMSPIDRALEESDVSDALDPLDALKQALGSALDPKVKEIIDRGNAHMYDCRCAGCLQYWAVMAYPDDDEWGPFEPTEINAERARLGLSPLEENSDV